MKITSSLVAPSTFISIFISILLFAVTPANASHHEKSQDVAASNGEETKLHPAVYVNSDKKAYEAMQALPKDQPLQMLNMIRYRDKADYKDNSEFSAKGWTGEQAYTEYGRHSSPIADRVGGKIIYTGIPQLTVIGPEHEKWDLVFIVHYPNLASFLALIGDPEYQKHAFHRSAAVADSRLIRMLPVTE